MTAPIADLQMVDPETFNSLKFDPAIETLQSFSKCAAHVTPEEKVIIDDMKAKGKLLPLLVKY